MSLLNDLIKRPQDAEKAPLKEFEELMEKANQAYYESDDPILSDEIFDILAKILEKRSPKFAQKIFAHKSAHKVVDLPYYMGSLDKLRNEKDITRWLKKYKGPYVEMEKLDGLAFLFSEGKLYTRGNGNQGVDISHILKWVNFPVKDYPVVGEMIVTKRGFEKIKRIHNYSTARAMVAGLIHSSKATRALVSKIHLVAFQIPNSQETPTRQLAKLHQDGYKTPMSWLSEALDFAKLEKRLTDHRKSSIYEIDGIVIVPERYYKRATSGNPKHSIAFKTVLEDQMAETTVTDIVWSVSRYGDWTPVVHFEPVVIGGVKIRKATGHNPEFLEERKINVGAKLLIIRSGDVIPSINKVIKPAKDFAKPPTGKKNKETLEQIQLKQHVHFLETLGVKGVKKGVLTKLNAQTMTTKQFLELPESTWIDILGTTAGPKGYAAVRQKLKDIPLIQAMVGSSCFEAGIGKRILASVLKEIPNLLTVRKAKEKLLEVPGIQEVTADKIIEGIKCYKKWLKQMKKLITVASTAKKSTAKSNKLADQVFAFTGFRDAELKKLIEANGGQVVDKLTKKTTTLITKDKTSTSSSMKKAKDYKIKIVQKDEFKV